MFWYSLVVVITPRMNKEASQKHSLRERELFDSLRKNNDLKSHIKHDRKYRFITCNAYLGWPIETRD